MASDMCRFRAGVGRLESRTFYFVMLLQLALRLERQLNVLVAHLSLVRILVSGLSLSLPLPKHARETAQERKNGIK